MTNAKLLKKVEIGVAVKCCYFMGNGALNRDNCNSSSFSWHLSQTFRNEIKEQVKEND